MKLHDSPSKSSAEENDEMSKLPAAQRKKLRQKQKKAEARAKRVTSTHFLSDLLTTHLVSDLLLKACLMLPLNLSRRLKRNKRMKQLHPTVRNLGRNNNQDRLIWIHMVKNWSRYYFSKPSVVHSL
jgi:hypothetical protein